MTAPFLPIHEFILLGMCDHPAWPRMIQEALKRGIPKYYVRDLYFHDPKDLYRRPHELPFYWCVRTCGTFLTTDNRIYSAYGRSDDQWAWFHWDGKELKLLEENGQ